MNCYIVTVIDRGMEVEYEVEAANVAEARRAAKAWFPAGTKIVSVVRSVWNHA